METYTPVGEGSSGRSSGGDSPGYVSRGGERIAPGDMYGALIDIISPQKDTFDNPFDKWNHLLGDARPEAVSKRQEDLQREFAQHGIRWRVEDAVRAGLNPEAALGTSGASYTPMTVMSSGAPQQQGRDLSQIGQNVIRSLTTTMTGEQRMEARLRLENMQLQNDLLRTNIKQMNSTPSMAGSENFMPSQGNSNLIKSNPMQKTRSHPEQPSQEPGWSPDVGWARTSTGLVPVPSKDIKERIEDQFIPETAWAIRNYLSPMFGESKPPKSMLPKGYDRWEWNPLKMEFRPVRGKGSSFHYGPGMGY